MAAQQTEKQEPQKQENMEQQKEQQQDHSEQVQGKRGYQPIAASKLHWPELEDRWGVQRDDLEKSGDLTKLLNSGTSDLVKVKPTFGGESFELDPFGFRHLDTFCGCKCHYRVLRDNLGTDGGVECGGEITHVVRCTLG